MRIREQEESAKLGGYEFELLRLPNGQPPREACLQLSAEFFADGDEEQVAGVHGTNGNQKHALLIVGDG